MQVFKTVVTNGKTILPIDTIAYQGGLWLVPHWIATTDGRSFTPDRMIRIDMLSLRKLDPPQPWNYHLLDCVPDDVLVGPLSLTDTAPFEVVERPKHIVRDISARR